MLVSSEEALDQVIRLDRTIGYPHPTQERDSFERLLAGLTDACNKHGVAPERVISACLEASRYCPTDHDLLTFAAGLRDVPPWKPAAPSACDKCHGSGFEISYMLHSREGNGEFAFTKKEPITMEQAELIEKKIDRRKQQIFSGAKRCPSGCPVPGWRA